MKIASFITIFLIILALIGEIKCIYKAITCNWEPVGKAEVIYTASALTGFGFVVGYIKDK
jgi:hypothetical protein